MISLDCQVEVAMVLSSSSRAWHTVVTSCWCWRSRVTVAFSQTSASVRPLTGVQCCQLGIIHEQNILSLIAAAAKA